MDLFKEIQIDEYNRSLPDYLQIEKTVCELLEKTLKDADINVMQIAHRVKGLDSAVEKMKRKEDKYTSINSMNDLIGFRIICYFSEQVDQIAELVSTVLDVDPDLSTDKRKLIDPTSFGYLSLHYICRLPKNHGYPEKLTEYTFEIQFRTVLQHAWAEIEHDLGYKSEYSIPVKMRREFSRVAGLLEIADETFEKIKHQLNDYTVSIHQAIKEDKAELLTLDLNTFTEYLHESRIMKELLTDICDISGSALIEISPESYLKHLYFFNIKTLGDLTNFIKAEYDHALMLARTILNSAELDELAITVGIHFVCRARLIFGRYDESEISEYFRLTLNDDRLVKQHVDHIIKQRNYYLSKETEAE